MVFFAIKIRLYIYGNVMISAPDVERKILINMKLFLNDYCFKRWENKQFPFVGQFGSVRDYSKEIFVDLEKFNVYPVLTNYYNIGGRVEIK